MKTDGVKWKWRSSLEAERSRAGPDKCVCIGLRLSGQIPQNDTRAQGRAGVQNNQTGDSCVSYSCCHGDSSSAAWIPLRVTQAASPNLKNTSPSPPEECCRMHRGWAVMENTFNAFLWHRVSHFRSVRDSVSSQNFPMCGRSLTLVQSFCQAAAFYERWQQTRIRLNGRNRAIKSRHLPTPGMMEPAEWAGCRNITSQFRNWSCWRASSWILWLK